MRTAKTKSMPGRMTETLLETAMGMRDVGVLNETAYEKITMRHLGGGRRKYAAITPAQIRALREGARMSQAVFAHHLNVTPGYVSQPERGARRPTGPALALLDVIRRKGIEAIL